MKKETTIQRYTLEVGITQVDASSLKGNMLPWNTYLKSQVKTIDYTVAVIADNDELWSIEDEDEYSSPYLLPKSALGEVDVFPLDDGLRFVIHYKSKSGSKINQSKVNKFAKKFMIQHAVELSEKSKLWEDMANAMLFPGNQK
jgi:hypothetical protein